MEKDQSRGLDIQNKANDALRDNKANDVLRVNHLLLIGIDSYYHSSNHPSLPFPVSQMTKLKNVLCDKYEFEEENTIFLKNDEATKKGILDAIDKYNKIEPLPLQRGIDKLVIVFAGHGAEDSNKANGYWIPYDAKEENDYIAYSDILSHINKISIYNIILIIDCCFSSTILRGTAGNGLRFRDELPSPYIIASSRRKEEAADDSVFMEKLISILGENRADNLRIRNLGSEISAYMESKKMQLPLHRQLDCCGLNDTNDFFFMFKSFSSLPLNNIRHGSFTDIRDQQTYRTIEIEDLVWMAQNFNYNAGGKCWYYNDKEVNGNKYGRLYTLDAAIKERPKGWRLPTDEEWKNLLLKFGGYFEYTNHVKKQVGDNPRKAYLSLMTQDFQGKLGGYRDNKGKFGNIEDVGSYWCDSGSDDSVVYYDFVGPDNEVYRRNIPDLGLSLSCRYVRGKDHLNGDT